MKPKVSVVLPTYNRAYTIGKSIDSVLNQTFGDLELIIVDDGSTDNTKRIIASYTDPRIKYFYSKINKGAAAARNYGVTKAIGEWIAFEDSDDRWRLSKLEKQFRRVEQDNNTPGFCYHSMQYDFGQGRYCILPSVKIPLERKNGNIFDQLLVDNMVGAPCLLVKKECLVEIGGFDESMKCLEDYDLALRLARKYMGVFVDEVLLDTTYSDNSVSLNTVQYILASCRIVQKYKSDYLRTNTLNHRLDIILREAERIGKKQEIITLLEKIMQC